jgi:hypothetical protein
MSEFDLIPPDYVRGKTLRRQMKWFIVALVAVASLVALGWLGLRSLVALENREVARLQEQGRLAALGKAKEEAYRQRTQVAAHQLDVLDELRGRDRMLMFFKAIDAAHVEGVWFDEVRFARRAAPGSIEAGAAGKAPDPKDPSAKPAEIEQVAEIAGYAVSHSKLAEFMRSLGRQPGIAAMRLIDSGLRTNANTQAIDARISLRVDDKALGRP